MIETLIWSLVYLALIGLFLTISLQEVLAGSRNKEDFRKLYLVILFSSLILQLCFSPLGTPEKYFLIIAELSLALILLSYLQEKISLN